MKDSQHSPSLIVFYSIGIICVLLSHILPHPYNLSPLTAVGIFLGTHRSVREGAGFVILTRFLTDVFLGFYQIELMLSVYLAHLAGVWLGYWIRGAKENRAWRILITPWVSAGVFFLITNFAFLYPEYSHDLAGIVQSYAMGLPFARGTFEGDVIYSYALFGGYALVQHFASAWRVRNAV